LITPSTLSRGQPESQPEHSIWPDLSLVGVALIWGINMPFMKTGLEQIDPFVFNAFRLIISAGSLAVFAWRERRAGIRPGPQITPRQIITFAVLVSLLYQLLFLLGIARTTAGNTGLILATVPAWTALLARIFIGERLSRTAWIGLAVALSGTVIVAVQKGISGDPEHLMGNILILCAALAWAGGTVYSRPLLNSISPMQLSASAALLALPTHLLIAAPNYAENLPKLQSVNLWLILAWAGVLSSGLSLPMWNYGVRHAGAAHAAAVQNLVPLVAILTAWYSRGEVATQPQLIGGGLILCGLVTMRLSRRARTNADADRPVTATVMTDS